MKLEVRPNHKANRRLFLKKGSWQQEQQPQARAPCNPAFGCQPWNRRKIRPSHARRRLHSQFLAAAENLEPICGNSTNELGGIQDNEVPEGVGVHSTPRPLKFFDGDMDQYIHDNTRMS